MQTQKIKTPKYGQTPYYDVDGWLQLDTVKTVDILNAIFEYDQKDGRWQINTEDGEHFALLWIANGQLTIILHHKEDGGK